MHKTLLVAALSLVAGTMNAQTRQQLPNPAWKPLFGGRHTGVLTRQILQQQRQQPAAKGTTATDRLVGWSIYQSAQLADSARYVYNTLTRGSTLDNLELNTYQDFGFDPIYTMQTPYPVSTDRAVVNLKFDTAYVMFVLNPGTADKLEFNLGRYYTGNVINREAQRVNFHYMGTDNPSLEQHSFNYNGAGNLIDAHYSYDTSMALTGSYVPYIAQYSTYSSNKVAQDSITDYSSGAPLPSENRTYTYDVSGNMTASKHYSYNGSAWVIDAQDLYTYTNGNKLHTHLAQNSDNTPMGNYSTDTFNYQGNNLVYNSYYEWDDNTGAWANGSVTNTYYNTQGNVDSQVNSNVLAIGLSPLYKVTFSYTSFGHIDQLKEFDVIGTTYSTTPSAVFSMYYQTYNPAGVNTPHTATLGAGIYPSPATDVLHIRFDKAPKSTIGVRIYNTTGQLVQSATLNNMSYQVPVGNLAPGNYIIDISNNEGEQRLQFVKL